MPQQVTSQAEATGCLPIVVRLFWLVAGNLVLLFLAISIAQRRDFSVRDFAYWVTVAALIITRHIDITRLGGQTKDCEPVSADLASLHSVATSRLGRTLDVSPLPIPRLSLP